MLQTNATGLVGWFYMNYLQLIDWLDYNVVYGSVLFSYR